MRAVVLGATRGIGRAVARELAGRGDAVFLLGRDPEDLACSVADLRVRAGREQAGSARCDLEDPATFAPALARASGALGGIDTIVVCAALFASQEQLEADERLRDRLLTVNFTNTIHFCEVARRVLLAAGGGSLCVLSSVAGERPRRPVVLYGAAKAGLSYYVEGLGYRFWREGLRVVLVKPGFVRTGMTAHLPEPPFASDPEPVARSIVRALVRGRPVVFVPPVWRLVMAFVRALPRAILRRVSF